MDIITKSSPRVVLASGSPRRLELMQRLGFEPLVYKSDIEEVPRAGESPEAYTLRLAREKGEAVADALAGDSELPGWVLSADTIVVLDGEILEKPADEADARAMLARLAGNTHEVITAYCWTWRAPGQPADARVSKAVAVRADVWMRELTEDHIRRYAASGEPMDKAGSYGIQDLGSTLVRRIEGSYFCVVGLPVCEVVETLEELGGIQGFPL
ncbi:septum formation inhibitor Maf [Lujinxingia vulgaris]|uniref:dTTP/UTP pyrophosphatase n=1 Tax=Lujinxingia vulgaris TaxID=2600176 RepID=A0A5C6XHH4_9DELT|nr:Maf family protein [Lujinxingia vulgaris]TXD37612.1 septum formation inhibitor Maf [Lujinxingia vulgaris]